VNFWVVATGGARGSLVTCVTIVYWTLELSFVAEVLSLWMVIIAFIREDF
jgi:hypothetical protein